MNNSEYKYENEYVLFEDDDIVIDNDEFIYYQKETPPRIETPDIIKERRNRRKHMLRSKSFLYYFCSCFQHR